MGSQKKKKKKNLWLCSWAWKHFCVSMHTGEVLLWAGFSSGSVLQLLVSMNLWSFTLRRLFSSCVMKDFILDCLCRLLSCFSGKLAWSLILLCSVLSCYANGIYCHWWKVDVLGKVSEAWRSRKKLRQNGMRFHQANLRCWIRYRRWSLCSIHNSLKA